jgi:hypothetical protein
LLPPEAAADDPDDDPDDVDAALAGVVVAMEAMRAEFVKAHGREPTEAEVIELVSLGLADGLDDDLFDELLMEAEEEDAILDHLSLDADEDEDDED